MGAAYAQDLRDRVLAAADRGMTTKHIAEVFAVSPAWVRRIKQRRRETGETRPRKMGGPGVPKIDRARLAQLVSQQPDATLWELRQRLGIDCAESSICVALKKMGLSFQKRRCTRPSRTGPMSPSDASGGDAPSPSATAIG